MNKKLIYLLFASFSICFANLAFAMRCHNQLIETGDSKAKVLQYCGKPSSKNKLHHRKNSKNYFDRKSRKYHRRAEEKWIYNFGPQDFIYVITFEKGKVSEITTEGYGNS